MPTYEIGYDKNGNFYYHKTLKPPTVIYCGWYNCFIILK